MRRFVLFTALAIVAISSISASAFDGVRKGFTLGGGAGLGIVSFRQEIALGSVAVESDREGTGAFVTDFNIGYGFTPKFVLYWSSRVNWLSLDNLAGETVTVSNGVGGIGVTFYMNEEAPSTYVTGGIGFGTWALPFEDSSDTWTGPGFRVGVGYEWRPHWGVELGITMASPSIDEGALELTTNATGVHVAVVGVAY